MTTRLFGSCSLVLCALVAQGCSALSAARFVAPSVSSISTLPSNDPEHRIAGSGISQAAAWSSVDPEEDAPAPSKASESISSTGELDVDQLVQVVLARNPSLAQMVAAWQAASARYPQVTSLDDPMFGTWFAPGSAGSNNVNFGVRAEISQKYPFAGKLKLRGDTALAEASAAGRDVADLRLQLIEATKSAFYDYYLVDRALVVNAEALRLLQGFRGNAETRYNVGRGSQQDLDQADVEIGRNRERQVELVQLREVVVARINTLMHLPTESPLPPPPQQIDLADALPNLPALQALAVAQRPDLQGLADRIAADEASLALARREFYPDFELLAAYDSFWQPPEQALRSQVGVRMNLPVRQAKRYAAVAEAGARLAQRRAELQKLQDQVNLQVQEAFAQVRKGEQVVRLYRETILPAAEKNVKSAQAAYIPGNIPFLTLIEAERSLVNVRDRYYEIIADYYRRLATLERVSGGPLARGVPVELTTPKQRPNG